MQLTQIEEALVLAAYFRGGRQDDRVWTSNSDQILTLSLFYTGDITCSECEERFLKRSYMQKLYVDTADPIENPSGELADEIKDRFRILISLLQGHPELIEGGGDFDTPADPTFTACRLTEAGLQLAESLKTHFPSKPDFPNWPDRRTMPE